MPPKKKSLKDDIFSLLAPNPETNEDPEGNLEAVTHFQEGDEEYERLVEETSRRSGNEGRLRIRPDIELDDPRYKGKVVSRKTVVSDSSEEEVEDDDDVNAEMDDVSSEDEDENSDEEDDDDGAFGGGLSGAAGAEDFEEFEEQQDVEVMKLTKVDSDELHRSKHANNQQTMIDSALEFRIMMQRGITMANRLPQTTTLAEFGKVDKNIEKKTGGCAQTCAELTSRLLDLRRGLVENNNSVKVTKPLKDVTATLAGKKRRAYESDALWPIIEAYDASLKPFRDEVLEFWGKKANVSSSYTQQFKSLNQSVPVQVSAMMANSDERQRMISNTKVKRSTYYIFGKPQVVSDRAAKEEIDDDAPAEVDVRRRKNNFTEQDEEIFDDMDFYQMMLRDLIESVGHSRADEDIMALREQLRAARKKQRGEVDPKATKGRKIKYTVQSKLVNFMGSQPAVIPPFAEELFKNLFGCKSA